MENVLLDRRSSGSFEFSRRAAAVGGGFRRPATAPRGAYGSSPKCQMPGGAWSHAAPALPYARPPLYSSSSLPLLPSNQPPPLLPFPPTATKYATFPYPPPPSAVARTGRASAVVPAPAAAAVAAPSRQRDWRRRPARPPPPSTEPTKEQKKKPLERATPLPPAPAVAEALDDLEQEVALHFVQDLLHVFAPPPSSLPLPRFSLSPSS
ncbi:hypothetical protein GUJ93_ZPchr0013g37696 [Zizania palustris]|uniref:Uncharacterized protein n=1 Tax=Zizania palustris TaxID=103762 RepID=A0A8J5WSB1_ZIZPA|nr:hypothetical protein GUJ93_ZPchr0013g36428 [Zizania palustris]KAG8096840.1 hypothetical protein GUJ93_ZPchr0013g37696 [Zizania palustris]